MSNDQRNQPDESLWRRKLSEAERTELRGQPERELEARLTDALAKVPDMPVPSNFTARVLNAIEFEERQAARADGSIWKWRFPFPGPRIAVAAAVLIFAGVGVQRYEANFHRLELAKNVARVAAQLPSVDALNNFDAIQRMSQPARADTELLAALQ